jgi:putative PEP-CTERM system TPR-repeat lipoprotein
MRSRQRPASPARNTSRLTGLLLLTLSVFSSCSRDPLVHKAKAFERAEQYYAERRFPDAILEYRRALQIDPKFARARFKLAESYAANNELKNAYTEYVRAADLLPDDLEVQIKAGNMLLLGRRFAEAKSRARTILQRDPNNLAGLLLLGNALAGLRDLDNAVAVTKRAAGVDPDRGGVYANLGALELARGDRDEAERAFAKAVELEPADSGAWLAQANFYRAVGKYDRAEQSFRQAVKVAPENARVNRAIASHYLDTNRPELAEPYLRKVAEAQKDAGSWLDLADFYLSTRRFADAGAVLKAVLETTPGFEVESRLALVEHAAGRIDEAHALIAGFLKKQPNHAGAQALEARLLLRENRVQDAWDKARSALRGDAQLPEAHFTIGLVNLARNETEDARKAFVEVLNLDPTATEARLELARLHTSRGELDTAIGYAEQSIKTEPANMQARIVYAQTLMVRPEDRPKAYGVIQGLLSNYPGSPAVYSALGSFYLAGNDRPSARVQFERALALDSGYLDALTSLIAMDLADGVPDQAWQRIYARLKQQPQDPDLSLIAAKFAITVGDTSSAEQYLRRTMAAAPGKMEPYTLLGQLFIKQGRLKDAIREFEEVTRRDANSVPGHTMLGLLHHSQRNSARAVWHYRRAVDLDSGAAAAANNLAWLYAENDENLDIALQLAQNARKKLPNSPEITDTLGWVYFKKNMLPLAITSFEQSLERDAKNPMYHYHLGLAFAKSGDDAKARVALQRAIAIRPNFPRADDAKRVLATLVY